MKKNKKLILILLVVLMLTTGCTKVLKDKDKKAVINKVTGQNLTENIVCRPTDPETIKLYKENKVDIDSLPYCVCPSEKVKVTEEVKDEDGNVTTEEKEVACESFKITSGKYEGLWTSIFIKPLAFIILFFGNLTKNYGLGLIITSLLIRLVLYPITRKTAMQSEYMKKAQPEMEKIEKKYANKDQNDQQVMMQKSQEMLMVYKKYNINPISGCLLAFIQLPLLIAFLEAINRVPAIFEGTMFGLHLGTTPGIGIFTNHNYWYLILSVIVMVTTYLSFKATTKDQPTTNSDMARQQKMMTNMFTVMIIVMSFFMTTALNIYWATTNLFTVAQNLIVRRRVK